MNYLFLDLECSNGNDICSVGYVLADEAFNVLEQSDVLINPESRFVLTNRAGTEGIQLAYKAEEFYSSPTFPKRYEWLKNMLEDDGVRVIGFAVSNDAGFIKRACNRYDLPQINFKFFDTQRLDAQLHNDGAVRGLSKIIDFYGIIQDEENILHKSDDDAYFTLEILRRMMDETSLSVEELMAKYPSCCGESAGGFISYDGRTIGNIDKMRKSDVAVFKERCADLKKQYKGAKGCLSNEKICFSRNLNGKNYRKVWVLAEEIYKNGGKFASIKDCSLFVSVAGEDNSQTSFAIENGANRVDLADFLKILGMDELILAEKVEKLDIMPYKKRADELSSLLKEKIARDSRRLKPNNK